MKKVILSILISTCIATTACNDSAGNAEAKKGDGETTSGKAKNHLSMKIDGKPWEADADIVGDFHPKGYNKLIMIAGDKGSGKNEQAFNINLYNTNGPGTFNIVNGNADLSVVQLANMSAEHYLYGSMMGFTMKVVVTKASNNPTVIEATFEGELGGNASDKIKITEGKFYYHE
jgi:hypothetical protein